MVLLSAEGEGFEPPVSRETVAFKATAISLSAILPDSVNGLPTLARLASKPATVLQPHGMKSPFT